MKIQNTQVGQSFASPGSKNAGVIESDVKRGIEGSETKERSFLNNGQYVNVNAAQDVSGKTGNQQILSQASPSKADTKEARSNGVELDDAIAKVESFLKVQNRDLAFTIDENTNRSVVTVKDSTSGDVIRQIPSEEVLKLADRIQELQQDVGDSVGVFINNQV
ncbi:flagellar protein FlaG [Alteromonas mediterranea]|uniref:flagellar protein FlaG n=1 Tax=Alteromonas mediterranea TaxID=314275 RepID=UPI00112FF6C9|nr:flagellar protein FlaG [Alteromonas mediterranea]QDG37680.1 flagellar protein FlaG [Alteromonas mediterranea]